MQKDEADLALSHALERLRKQGYSAFRALADCRTCSWALLTDKQAKRAVFTDDQDEKDWKEKGRCYLSWSGSGKTIIKALEAERLHTSWTGKKTDRICVW